MNTRYALLLIAAAGLVALAAGVLSPFRAEVSTYSRGARVYADHGCGACHESLVLEPIPKRRKPTPHVFKDWTDASELSDQIRFGAYEADDYAVAQREIPRKIKMPAYNDLIAEADFDALRAFLRVNQLINLPSTSEGQNLASEYGCFNCHGPLGLGGVANPRALNGTIPGWFGDAFDELTDDGDRKVVAEWITDGTSAFITGKSFGRGRLARHFGESQAIKMPAFERRIPQQDVDTLVDYVLLLRGFGDMGLPEVERYKARYAVDTESAESR